MPYKKYDNNPFDDYQGYDQYGSDIEALMNRLIGQQKMIQSTLKDEVDRTMSQITQTADEIRQEITDFENDVYSEISQTADQIQSTINDLDNNLQSQITQNADSITSTVTRLDSAEDDIVSAQTQISQNATDITSTVSQIGGLEDDIAAAQTQITQNADNIDLRVRTTDYNGNNIISRINLSSTTATIQATRINFIGTASFTLGQNSSNDSVTSIEAGTLISRQFFGTTQRSTKLEGGSIMLSPDGDWNNGPRLLGNSNQLRIDSILSFNAVDLRVDGDIYSYATKVSYEGHSHSAGDVTSGTLSIYRLPVGTGFFNVSRGNHTHSASAITSGTLAAARIPDDLNTYIKTSGVNQNIRLQVYAGRVQWSLDGGDFIPLQNA